MACQYTLPALNSLNNDLTQYTQPALNALDFDLCLSPPAGGFQAAWAVNCNIVMDGVRDA